jgi:hypothetical protein
VARDVLGIAYEQRSLLAEIAVAVRLDDGESVATTLE